MLAVPEIQSSTSGKVLTTTWLTTSKLIQRKLDVTFPNQCLSVWLWLKHLSCILWISPCVLHICLKFLAPNECFTQLLHYAEAFSVKPKKSHQLWLDRMQICAFPSGILGKVIKQRTLCLQNAFWVISSQDKKTICQEESFHVPLSVLTFL